MKNLKQWRSDNPGEWGHYYSYILQSKLGPTQKLVLTVMMSDYDMNGIIRWTREKYMKETGSSYSGVCDTFNFLKLNGILKPIEGTSNYDFDLEYLKRRMAANKFDKLKKHQKKTVTEYSNTVTEYTNTVTEYSKSDTEYSKTDTEYQHIDNKDLKDNKDLYREDEDVFKTSSPSTQEIANWASNLDG